MKSNSGFTVMELVICVALVAIVLLFVAPLVALLLGVVLFPGIQAWLVLPITHLKIWHLILMLFVVKRFL